MHPATPALPAEAVSKPGSNAKVATCAAYQCISSAILIAQLNAQQHLQSPRSSAPCAPHNIHKPQLKAGPFTAARLVIPGSVPTFGLHVCRSLLRGLHLAGPSVIKTRAGSSASRKKRMAKLVGVPSRKVTTVKVNKWLRDRNSPNVSC